MKAYFYSESHLYIFIESKYNLCIHPPPKKTGLFTWKLFLTKWLALCFGGNAIARAEVVEQSNGWV